MFPLIVLKFIMPETQIEHDVGMQPSQIKNIGTGDYWRRKAEKSHDPPFSTRIKFHGLRRPMDQNGRR